MEILKQTAKEITIIIITDTREQTPLEFEYEYVSEIRKEGLPVGDYACEFSNGYRPAVVFERKSLPDIFGTMGKGYKRFRKEIDKSKQMGIRLVIIIEKPLMTVMKGYPKSDMSGVSVARRLFTLWVKHDVCTVYCKDRDECSRYIYETYCAIGRLMVKSNKSKENKVDYAELQALQRTGNLQVVGNKVGSGN